MIKSFTDGNRIQTIEIEGTEKELLFEVAIIVKSVKKELNLTNEKILSFLYVALELKGGDTK